MEELRAGLVRSERPDGEDPSTTRMAVEATRDELQAVSHQIATLADKIERIERGNGDPEAALEQIERQIAGIAAQIADRDGREPEVAALGVAVADMMGEVAAWRHTLADVAERAARLAVEETLSNWSPPAPRAAARAGRGRARPRRAGRSAARARDAADRRPREPAGRPRRRSHGRLRLHLRAAAPPPAREPSRRSTTATRRCGA